MKKVAIIGSGIIGLEYAKCLNECGNEFVMICQSEDTLQKIKEKYSYNIISGGIENNINVLTDYNCIIIVTQIVKLYDILNLILSKYDNKEILVEKPGCLLLSQLELLNNKYDLSKIYVAYNRRFYESVFEAKKILESEKPIRSKIIMNERQSDLYYDGYDKCNLDNWFMCMTTHLFDLFIYLCGKPKKFKYVCDGFSELKNHSKSSIFSGNGLTENNVSFAYEGNWNNDGKWYLEIETINNIIIFSPLEKLCVVNKNTNEKKEFLPKNYDLKFKHGFFEQTVSFLNDKHNLLNMIDQLYNTKNIYYKICNYDEYKTVLLVGCGNIGYRHLQALLSLNIPSNINIVEKSKDRQEYLKSNATSNIHKINIFENISDIDKKYIDLAIYASCSDVRLQLIKDTVSNKNINYIKNIVLEKVIFQSFDDFLEFDNIISKYKNVNIFMNSYMNSMKQYDLIKNVKNPKIICEGGNWGLLCNSIHMLSLYDMFYGLDDNTVLTIDKNFKIIPSKRHGFLEMFGCIKDNNNIIELITSKDKNDNEYTIKVICESGNTFLYEFKNDYCCVYNNDNKYTYEPKDQYMSLIHQELYKELLLYNQCNLPTYKCARKLHKIFFDLLENIFNSKKINIT